MTVVRLLITVGPAAAPTDVGLGAARGAARPPARPPDLPASMMEEESPNEAVEEEVDAKSFSMASAASAETTLVRR